MLFGINTTASAFVAGNLSYRTYVGPRLYSNLVLIIPSIPWSGTYKECTIFDAPISASYASQLCGTTHVRWRPGPKRACIKFAAEKKSDFSQLPHETLKQSCVNDFIFYQDSEQLPEFRSGVTRSYCVAAGELSLTLIAPICSMDISQYKYLERQ